ncbi:MAG TPA: hypothetical protein ENJ09_11470 [Planctomycetes bacterium]|nr:hypothetical protein [Planctomycetota bacterium]
MSMALRLFVGVVALAAPSSLVSASPQDVSVPWDVPTIQAGIDAVGPGGTVFVSPGIYEEALLIDPGGTLGPARGQDTMAIEASAPGVIVTWTIGSHGQPATIVSGGKVQDYNLAVVGATSVAVRGLSFDGRDDIVAGDSSMAVLFQDASGSLENAIVHGYRDSATSGIQNGVGALVRGPGSVVTIDGVSFFDVQKTHVVGEDGARIHVVNSAFTGRGVTSSIAQNGVQFTGTVGGPDANGSVKDSTFTGFWYDGGTYTATAILNYDSGGGVLIEGNTFLDCQAGVYDTSNRGKVTTKIRENTFEQITPWGKGLRPQGVVIRDGTTKNAYQVFGNVFRNFAGAGVVLMTGGGSVTNNWFDGNGTVTGDNARDDGFGLPLNVWDNNTWSDLAGNPLAPAAYLVPGAIGSIDSTPQSGAASMIYGTLNPTGSLTILSEARIGETFEAALDNPLGTQSPGAMGLLAFSNSAQPNFPAGILLPGYGMAGGPGELLIDLGGPLTIFPGTPWLGSGSPSLVSQPVPNDAILIGVVVYGQGILLDPSSAVRRALTEGVRLTMGF